MTEIGERGLNLSGGQKARISLARAVYANRDAILMDDPVSALDKGVMKQIFKNLFVNELKDKTRLLVTHSVEDLEIYDRIILMKDGEYVGMGTYKEIQNHPYLIKIIQLKEENNKKQETATQSSVVEKEKSIKIFNKQTELDDGIENDDSPR